MTAWVSTATVLADRAFCSLEASEELTAKAEEAAVTASSILYVLSGRSVGGRRTVTVYPLATDSDDVTLRQGNLRDVALEWPVIEVTEVVLDGETLVAGTDYAVHDYRLLHRLPDSDGVTRYWPHTTTIIDGFSITYVVGTDIPPWAEDAARELAVAYLRQRLDMGSPLPDGLTNASVQGKSYTLKDRAQALRDGVTQETFPEVLRFIGLVNPRSQPYATHAWSPDLGHQLVRVTG